MRLVRRRMVKDVVELNITAFLNLMVILVPFLLITAVFSRIAILELNLPSKNAKTIEGEQVKLQLELVIRPDSFEIQDRNFGRIQAIPRNNQQADWNRFDKLLRDIKARFPDETNITLMIDEQVDYKTIIEVMDRVRSAEVVNIADVETISLFPNISIADAPPPIETGTDTPTAQPRDGQ